MKKIALSMFVLILSFEIYAQNQDLELANEYYQQQEYEKASEMYAKLARKSSNLKDIYKNYLSTLFFLKDFQGAEKLVNKQIKNEPYNPTFKIDYGLVLERQGKIPQADKHYDELIQDIRKMTRPTLLASEHFLRLDKPDLALKLLLVARKAQKDKIDFTPQIAEVYFILGQKKEMVQEYITYARKGGKYTADAKNALQDKIYKPEEFEELEKILLTGLQKNANEVAYNELLLWVYLQQKLFYRAFIQAKALDKRYKLEGSELLEIGLISLNNKDYKSAKAIFGYVVKTYPRGDNYSLARTYHIQAQEEVVKHTYPVSLEDIKNLIKDYQTLIDEEGKSYRTFNAMRSMSMLYAFYLDDKDKAIDILNQAVQASGGRSNSIAKAKIDLGDIYLLKDESWESTLLYSQAEKIKDDHPIGYEAKLKNAKLSYYKGEFDLAKEHLDILKEATSREIANDALDLGLLIQDNVGFDSLGTALKEYSKIDLLIFQHQDEKALELLNQMLTKHKGHSITDEVLWLKANILLKLAKPEEAVKVLEQITAEFGEDILGDDAHFLMAKTYEEVLKDKDKAKQLYEDQLTKYPGSIYTAEARKRFRILRGDFVNQ